MGELKTEDGVLSLNSPSLFIELAYALAYFGNPEQGGINHGGQGLARGSHFRLESFSLGSVESAVPCIQLLLLLWSQEVTASRTVV